MTKSVDLLAHAYRIYFVEDSPILLRLLQEMLGRIPGAYIVGQSGSADEAISEIAKHRPHAIIVDLMLQSGTGFEVLAAVATSASAPLAIVLTNLTMAPHRDRAMSLGAAYFFDKSTEIVEMCREVGRLVEEHQKPPGSRRNGY